MSPFQVGFLVLWIVGGAVIAAALIGAIILGLRDQRDEEGNGN